MEYSCQIFHLNNFFLIKNFDLLQRKALKIALGYRSSTPNKIVTIESGIPTMILRMVKLTRDYYIRNLGIMTSPVTSVKELKELIEKMLKKPKNTEY